MDLMNGAGINRQILETYLWLRIRATSGFSAGFVSTNPETRVRWARELFCWSAWIPFARPANNAVGGKIREDTDELEQFRRESGVPTQQNARGGTQGQFALRCNAVGALGVFIRLPEHRAPELSLRSEARFTGADRFREMPIAGTAHDRGSFQRRVCKYKP